MRAMSRILCSMLALALGACSTLPTPEARSRHAGALAHDRGWQAVQIETRPFRLRAFLPASFVRQERLTLYLEGDGLAWITSSQPSADPTPSDPLALRLALAHPQGNAAYLARPCQYLGAAEAPCERRYWTDARFAEEVVASLDQAIDELKNRAGAQRLVLVGYSGGAALALLLAARRDDVSQVVTVAGNLDHAAWTRHHRVQPLRHSLNPIEQAAALARVEQVHLLGAADRVVPPGLGQAFVAAMPAPARTQAWILPGHDHHCCWADEWPDLWRRVADSFATPGTE